MSRPQKMHKPLKGSFTDIINAVADGKGMSKLRARDASHLKNIVKASEPPKPPTPPKP
jgi:hypothetical protein